MPLFILAKPNCVLCVFRGRVEGWQEPFTPSSQVWFTLSSSTTHHSRFMSRMYPCRRYPTGTTCALRVRNGHKESDLKHGTKYLRKRQNAYSVMVNIYTYILFVNTIKVHSHLLVFPYCTRLMTQTIVKWFIVNERLRANKGFVVSGIVRERSALHI